MSDLDAYIGLKHLAPETVRLMRFALDVGVSIDRLREDVRSRVNRDGLTAMTLQALDWMAANPNSGRVEWKGQSYTFRPEAQ